MQQDLHVALSTKILVSMISQLIILSFVLLLMLTYFKRSYASGAREAGHDVQSENNNFAASPTNPSKDLGFWGSLKIIWKLRSKLWRSTQAYEAVKTILEHNSRTLVRFFIVTSWKSAGRVAVCSDLETIKQVFRSNQWLNRMPDDHYVFQTSFGKPLGISFGNGVYWKAARKAVVKGFRDQGLLDVSRLEEIYSHEIHSVLNYLRDVVQDSGKDSAVFNPIPVMQGAAINVVFGIIFSRKPSPGDPFERRLGEMINLNNDNINIGFSGLDFVPFLQNFPMLVPSARNTIKVCRAIYDIVANERERRAKSGSSYRDLMDSFLQEVEAQHEGSDEQPNYFTFKNLQVTIRDLIMAGSETVHVSIEHLILFLATNREEQKKVQEEIDRVIGRHGVPTYEHRKRMIYTQAVIQETWRLSSLVPASIRTNSQDCWLGGMDMKKGTLVVPFYMGVHHSAELWEDPMVFKPSRFISDCGSQLANTDKTLTFSYGPRACPGELVGRVGVFLFTVALLRDFEWEPSDLHPPPSFKCRGELSRAPVEYFVKIRRR